MTARARLAAVLYGVGSVAYLVDRVTKIVVEQTLIGRPPIVLIPGVVQLRYTTNAGGAFGLFGGQPWLFFAATVGVCAVIVALSTRLTSRLSALGLGLILGGAVGNLTDRILHAPGLSGEVTDFVDLHIWPVFNAADAAIVIGAALVVLASFRQGSTEQPAEP
jgi:signal peptidase II